MEVYDQATSPIFFFSFIILFDLLNKRICVITHCYKLYSIAIN